MLRGLLKKQPLISSVRFLSCDSLAKNRLSLLTAVRLINNNNSPRASFSTEASAVGFNDYEKGVEEDRLDVPTYFNFAEDVLEKWCLEEQVSFLDFIIEGNLRWNLFKTDTVKIGHPYKLTVVSLKQIDIG